LIIIVTNKNDAHADHLIRNVDKSTPILRINSDNFADEYDVVVRVSCDGILTGSISDHHGRLFDFTRPAVVWYRKPHFDLTEVSVDSEHKSFCISEIKSFFEILYSLPSLSWINHPNKIIVSRSKVQQLILARALGFLTPDTLISNSVIESRQFFLDNNKRVITKSIYSATVRSNGMDFSCTTRAVADSDMDERGHLISFCPTQFQSAIEKAFELRVTVVGGEAFFTKIESQVHERTKTDWRIDTDLCEHSAFCPPDWLSEACLQIVQCAGLQFGAIDIICDLDGNYWFLENNPGGQYLWIELLTGQPITAAVITLLETMLNEKQGV
jgi:hypothetical protein